VPTSDTIRPDQKPPPCFRLAHISDIHFGKISHAGVVGALVDEVNRGDFDAVVISGDLTQRAREREFRPAREMIDAMQPAVVVVPGNHDVPPWWRPIHRLTDAGAPFRKYISEDITPSFRAYRGGLELAIFGLDSSHGLSIAGGRIRSEHIDQMSRFYAARQPGAFRVLTVHHQLTQVKALGPHDVARGARRTLRRAADCGVELLLCGHLHMSHVAHIELDVEDGHRIVLASAGTATSSRGRRHHRNVNFYNNICVWPDRFAVEERRFDPDTQKFSGERVTPFARMLGVDVSESASGTVVTPPLR
jgi:3',5'-cyclic AMP phosphodiesterase CpdA